MGAPLLPTGQLDYTGIERESLLIRAQRLFTQVNPYHEDYSSNFPENLLLESTVSIVDMIRAVMEQRVRQCYWSTVTERRAAARLGRVSWFQLTGASASTVDFVFTAVGAVAISRSVVLPAGTRVRSTDPNKPLTYRTLVEVTKPAATAAVSVAAENADVQSESFASTNAPNQEYTVPYEPYIDGTAAVHDDGGSYELIDSFLGPKSDGTAVGSTDRCCVATMNDQYCLVIRFGDGITGAIPQGTVVIDYKTGGGSIGAVDANVTWQVESTIVDSMGAPVSFVVSNAVAAVPGIDVMTIGEAKVLGPLSMRTINRCVNEDDFEYVARLVPGIARAALVNRSRDTAIQENCAKLLLIAFGTQYASGYYAPAAATTAQISAVTALIAQSGRYPALMGVAVDVLSAGYLDVTIEVRVNIAHSYTPAQVAANVRSVLQDFFSVAIDDKTANPLIGFGYELVDSDGIVNQTLEWSAIFDAIFNAAGVRAIPYGADSLLLNGAPMSVVVPTNHFPRLSTIVIRNWDDGGTIITG